MQVCRLRAVPVETRASGDCCPFAAGDGADTVGSSRFRGEVMTDFRQDLDGLETVETQLRSLHAEFVGAAEADRDLGWATGHARLGRVVDDFGRAWDDRRANLAEQLLRVADLAQAIRETTREMDDQLARSTQIQGGEG